VNLFPNYANARQLGTEDYKEYVNRFAAEIPLQFLSYDSYPLTAAEDIFSKWHQNLEIIAATAKTSGKPFWAFAQSVLFDNKHEMPSLATLRLQQYTNLAYGAQGLQYFTYWTPVSTTENFRNAPLSLTGQRSPLYDLVKTLNQEIKAVSRVFLGSKLVSVHYAGNLIPKGCSRLSLLPKGLQVLETGGKTLLVSELENKGQRYLVMVNNDYMQTLRLNILGQEQLKRVLKDGSEVSLSTKENSFDVEPGDVVILKMI
jgi:hypothetical protein